MSSLKLKATGFSMPTQVIDAAEVRRAITLLASPESGHYCQLIGLSAGGSPGQRTCPGSDIDSLCASIGALTDYHNLYITLNPVKGQLVKKASAADVLQRRWLFLDIDPYKPAEHKNHPATDEEHDKTRQATEAIRAHLAALGWPAPIVVDSGNGWYLLYRIHMDPGKQAQAVIRRFLHAMRQLVLEQASVDPSVHDAPRFCALPGTMKRKGVPSDDRPWRPVRLVYVPDKVEVVSHEQIVAATPDTPKDAGTKPTPPPIRDEEEDEVEEESLPRKKSTLILKATDSRAAAYSQKALDNECARVALSPAGSANPLGGRNNTLFQAALKMGGFIASGYLTLQEVAQRLTAAACQCGLDQDAGCGLAGIEKTICSGIERGMEKPRKILSNEAASSAAGQPPPPAAWEVVLDDEVLADGTATDLSEPVETTASTGTRRFQIYTLPALMAADLPDPCWVVPGILSEGLNILAGKPKMGKSLLALNLGMTISGGGLAFSSIRTTPGDVLYLALEDKNRRLQRRARLMAMEVGYGVSSRLSLATSWPRLHEGGLHFLRHWMDRVERPTLVIIDVWAVFRPAYRTGGNQYEQDYEHLTRLKQFVEERDCTALVLMHCRKGSSEDALEEVSGTMGQTGAADGIIVLSRSRANNEAKIFVTGRDVDEQELALQFTPATLTWKSLGPAEQHCQGKLQQSVLAYLQSLPPNSSAFATDIASSLHEEPNKIRMTLLRLFEKRMVRRVGKAWAYPGEGEESEAVL